MEEIREGKDECLGFYLTKNRKKLCNENDVHSFQNKDGSWATWKGVLSSRMGKFNTMHFSALQLVCVYDANQKQFCKRFIISYLR